MEQRLRELNERIGLIKEFMETIEKMAVTIKNCQALLQKDYAEYLSSGKIEVAKFVHNINKDHEKMLIEERSVWFSYNREVAQLKQRIREVKDANTEGV